jgi:hypothetical protein
MEKNPKMMKFELILFFFIWIKNEIYTDLAPSNFQNFKKNQFFFSFFILWFEK